MANATADQGVERLIERGRDAENWPEAAARPGKSGSWRRHAAGEHRLTIFARLKPTVLWSVVARDGIGIWPPVDSS